MIATCGHRVSEGISCSVDEFQYDSNGNRLVSYGTYCSSCLIKYHEEGRIENEEISIILSKLKAQQEVIEEFNKDRRRLYKELTRLNDLLCNGYIYYDDTTESVINKYIETGKKAREALAKMEAR